MGSRNKKIGPPGGSRGYLPIDRFFLLFIFLIPIVPRPTVDHVVRYAGPVFIVAAVLVFGVWLCTLKPSQIKRHPRTSFVTFLVFAVVLCYMSRVIFGAEWDELAYLVSRVLVLLAILSFFGWQSVRGMSPRVVYKALFYGYLVLSVLVIAIGVTGLSVFGDVLPPRTYGVRLPFYKTAGVPRSYGEFGILATAAWAYVLVYCGRGRFLNRSVFAAPVILSVIISQSRSTYIAMIFVTLMYLCSRSRLTARSLCVFFFLAAGIPLAVDFALPFVQDVRLGEAFIGEGVYRNNVFQRFSGFSIAGELLTRESAEVLFGIPHSEWIARIYRAEGVEVGLHNHFLSNLLFLGLIGGLLNLSILLLPISNLVSRPQSNREERLLLALTTAGLLISLNFYEGFFSIITALEVSVLWYSWRPNSFVVLNGAHRGLYHRRVQQIRWRSSIASAHGK